MFQSRVLISVRSPPPGAGLISMFLPVILFNEYSPFPFCLGGGKCVHSSWFEQENDCVVVPHRASGGIVLGVPICIFDSRHVPAVHGEMSRLQMAKVTVMPPC